MTVNPDINNIEDYLQQQSQKDQLRFLTCGSVDDGKSTLLGRLLYDSKSIFEDQLDATAAESRRFGTQGGEVDLALLVDGLQAEREQGITIDVAYRFFETDKRKFIAADTPGHEQYTRNMATGASTSEVAIILVDARQGMLTQTRRHSFIVALMGIGHVILAVNKMDAVDYDQASFDNIVTEYKEFAHEIGLSSIDYIPLSALTGENVFKPTGKMPWYQGPSLVDVLENVQLSKLSICNDHTEEGFRLPVQWVNRPDSSFRGFSGTVAAGSIRQGSTVSSSLTGRQSAVKRIFGPAGELPLAITGQAITLELEDEIDISRGDVIAGAVTLPEVTDQFAAHIIWMDEDALLPERNYLLRFATDTATGRVTDLSYRVDVNSLEQLAAKTLTMNEVGYCKLALDKPVAFDPYNKNARTGAFVIIDRVSNATVGAGVIDYALRRASNIEWHRMNVDRQARSQLNEQRPCVVWFTGLSGAGKSTVADCLEQKLFALQKHTFLLDGDNVRHGLNQDLGFTDEARVENIRRVSEVSKLMVDAGLIVLVSFISPFRAERQLARDKLESGEFIEVFVDTPLTVCESRDPKGLYKKARAGDLKNFTGIDSVYERPENPELTLLSGELEVEALADQVIDFLKQNNHI